MDGDESKGQLERSSLGTPRSERIRRWVLATGVLGAIGLAGASGLLVAATLGLPLWLGLALAFVWPVALGAVFQVVHDAVFRERVQRHMSREFREFAPGVLLVPAFKADIVSQIESDILGFFGTAVAGVESFFGSIGAAFANLISSIINAPVQAVQAAWAEFIASTAAFGFFAPIITVLMIAAVVIIVVVLIWLMIRISTSEGEEEVGEVEEGV